MRCLGKFLNDRTCDLCKETNLLTYMNCKDTHDKKINELKELNSIKSRCPYRKECLDEYEWFDGCTIKGYAGRHTPNCSPNLKCKERD